VIRGAVQTSPRKPCASAPLARKSWIWARCSGVRRWGGPGAIRRRKDSRPPSGAFFSQWLTAPSVTPNAVAMAHCFQPRWANSHARKRRHSRRSLVGMLVDVGIPDPPAHLRPPLSAYAGINKQWPLRGILRRGGGLRCNGPMIGDRKGAAQCGRRSRQPIWRKTSLAFSTVSGYRGEQFLIQRNGEKLATLAPAGASAGIRVGGLLALSRQVGWPDEDFADDVARSKLAGPRSSFPKGHPDRPAVTGARHPTPHLVSCQIGRSRQSAASSRRGAS